MTSRLDEYNNEEAYIEKITHVFGMGASARLVIQDHMTETHRHYTLEFEYDPTPWKAKITQANSDYDTRQRKWKEGLFTGEWNQKQEDADLKARLTKYKNKINEEQKIYKSFIVEATLTQLQYKMKKTVMDLSVDIHNADIIWEAKDKMKNYKMHMVGSSKT